MGIYVVVVFLAILMLVPAFLLKNVSNYAYPNIVGYLGIAYLFIFFLTVTVPYYYQGYTELSDKCSIYFDNYQCPNVYPTTLGWTKNPLIGFFSYFLGSGFGSVWLTCSILFISHGNLSLNKKHNLIIKTVLIILACWSLQDSYRYQMLNDALE